MNWLFVVAIFFITWWVMLFAVLPFSLRTQDEEGNVTLGTVKSAPRGSHVLRAMLRTTAVTIVVFSAWYVSVEYLGFGLDDIPRLAPRFD